MNRVLALCPLFLVAACASTHNSIGDASIAKSQFELLRSLEGNWTAVMESDGKKQESETQFHVTGAGSAIAETIGKGTDHEMISMYHVDGGHLMHTHYCALGNQPRMLAKAGDAKDEIAFEFLDATNMPSPKAVHMHQMRIVVHDSNHVEEWWQGFKDGVMMHEGHFVLTRKQ